MGYWVFIYQCIAIGKVTKYEPKTNLIPPLVELPKYKDYLPKQPISNTFKTYDERKDELHLMKYHHGEMQNLYENRYTRLGEDLNSLNSQKYNPFRLEDSEPSFRKYEPVEVDIPVVVTPKYEPIEMKVPETTFLKYKPIDIGIPEVKPLGLEYSNNTLSQMRLDRLLGE